MQHKPGCPEGAKRADVSKVLSRVNPEETPKELKLPPPASTSYAITRGKKIAYCQERLLDMAQTGEAGRELTNTSTEHRPSRH